MEDERHPKLSRLARYPPCWLPLYRVVQEFDTPIHPELLRLASACKASPPEKQPLSCCTQSSMVCRAA